MSLLKKTLMAITGNEDDAELSKMVKSLITGDFLTKTFFKKQYRLLIMIAFLLFMYVDNRYACEAQLARQIELKKQIQDAKYESLTISAELMRLSRQSNVMSLIRQNGLTLEESATPPIVINDSTAK